jgi:hypothetical protein
MHKSAIWLLIALAVTLFFLSGCSSTSTLQKRQLVLGVTEDGAIYLISAKGVKKVYDMHLHRDAVDLSNNTTVFQNLQTLVLRTDRPDIHTFEFCGDKIIKTLNFEVERCSSHFYFFAPVYDFGYVIPCSDEMSVRAYDIRNGKSFEINEKNSWILEKAVINRYIMGKGVISDNEIVLTPYLLKMSLSYP